MKILLKSCFFAVCFLVSVFEVEAKTPKALPVTRGNGVNSCGKEIRIGSFTSKRVSSRKKNNRRLRKEDLEITNSDYRKSESRSLDSLQELHAMQMLLVSRGSRLSRAEQSRLKKDIRSMERDIREEMSEIDKFPYLSHLGSLHEYAERIYRNGGQDEFRNLNQQQILEQMQTAQLEALKKHINSEALERKYKRLREN